MISAKQFPSVKAPGTAAAFIAVLTSQVGVREGTNNDNPYGRWYPFNFAAWCAIFISWAAEKSGCKKIIPKHAFTPAGANWFKAKGQWHTGRPKVGDIAYFYNASLGRVAHVEGVVKVYPDGSWLSCGGNGLPLHTPVLTSEGWRPIGDLRPGDPVTDPDGKPSAVTGVYPQGDRPCYRVILADGRSIVADDQHRWAVDTMKCRDVFTTSEIRRRLPGASMSLPLISEPPDLPTDAPCDIDPWVIGVLLGDGCTSTGYPRFATTDDWMVARMEALTGITPSAYGSNQWYLPGLNIHDLDGVANCRSWEKHLPASCLGGTAKHRLALLRGLMDTDGDCDRRGRATFTTSSKALAHQVRDLVYSLGGIAGMGIRVAPVYAMKSGERRTGRPSYRVQNIRMNDNPFTRPRKAARFVVLADRPRVHGRRIVAVEPVANTETVCISVSAPSQLYIAGDWFVTHNTNNTGSREGNGVYLQKRTSTRGGGFGRPAYLPGAKQVVPVDLSRVIAKAKDSGIYDGRVAEALKAEGLPANVKGYAKWQESKAGGGYSGKDANGIAGADSLGRLGEKYGWNVKA